MTFPGHDATDGASTSVRGAELWIAAIELFMVMLRTRTLHEITLEQVATGLDVPLDRVQEQHANTTELLISAVQTWSVRRMEAAAGVARDHGAVAHLRHLLAVSVADAAVTRGVLYAAAIAGTPGNPYAETLQQLWIGFHASVQRALITDIALGREPDTMHPSRGAEQLLALYEGLQFQWLLRPSMDVLEAFDRAATRLRHGWAEAYAPPVWDI